MKRSKRRRSRKAGLAPGTMVYIGEQKAERPCATIISYDEHTFTQHEYNDISHIKYDPNANGVLWCQIAGITNLDLIAEIGKNFNLHPLVLEDIVNTEQRVKIDDYSEYLFFALKFLTYSNEKKVEQEQVSIILGRNFVITFRENQENDCFQPVLKRLLTPESRLRRLGADFLTYSLLDAIVDNYFILLESFEEDIESLEEELVTDPRRLSLQKINDLKRQAMVLRKVMWPMREVIHGFEAADSRLLQSQTGIYLRDIYDHVIQIIDTIEAFRDILTGNLDIYLSSVNNRMNEVMKVLTIIATLFMPLTFITGLYGMNFKWMPELDWKFGYPFVWMVLVIVALNMIWFFKRKEWF